MELKMTSRQMERQSQKMEQQEKLERKKILDVKNPSSNEFRHLTRATWIMPRSSLRPSSEIGRRH